MPVSKRVTKIGVSPTMKVAAEAKEMQSRGENVIDLSVGEPDFDSPQNVKDAAKRAIDANQTRYTLNNGTLELRKAISQKLKSDNNLEYTPADIIVSCGAKHSLFNTIQSIVHIDDEVIIPAPYWVSYPEMVTLAYGQSVYVDTTEKTGFKLTPQLLKEAISPYTKALILCNPSNPTGSAYSKQELEAIAEIVEQNRFYVISDEIYEKLIYGDYKFVSFASLSEPIKKKTITVNGLSKSYAMTGWRIGYAAGPSHIIDAINKIQSHSTSNAASISQAAAVEALNGPQESVEYMRSEFEKRRDYFYKELTSIKGITCYKPEGAFYLFPNISAFFGKSSPSLKITSSMDFAMYLLRGSKIATVPGSAFGAEGYIRLSYATSMEKLKDAVSRIKEAISNLS